MSSDVMPAVSRRTWIGFLCMCLGMFMAVLDIQIVATSLPTIQHALGIAPERLVWVQTAYLTAEIVAIPLTGYLIGRLGLRWHFVLALTLFTLASIGCAQSNDFPTLMAWRVMQGLAGGTLIPAVFSAVFLMFPDRSQGLATTFAGVAAVIAPTIGPIIGGWITDSLSWHWLFRINIVPGGIAASIGIVTLRGEGLTGRNTRRLDPLALAALALSLTSLEIGLQDAPTFGWLSTCVLRLLGLSLISGVFFVLKTLRASSPLVELKCFSDRNFAIGCTLSFVLGVGLFGSTYLMPFFLGLVREKGALQIGEIMLVTGFAQLAAAPIAVALERKVGRRLLALAGFSLFAGGLLLSSRQTQSTDAAEMLLPQIMRGAAIMFCLLPPTRIALGRLSERLVADGSGLFNLMRNLGGAVGLSVINTIIFSRSATHSADIVALLKGGSVSTAIAIGIPREAFLEQLAQPPDEFAQEMVRPLIEKAALVYAINDAWAVIGIFTAITMLVIFLIRKGTGELLL